MEANSEDLYEIIRNQDFHTRYGYWNDWPEGFDAFGPRDQERFDEWNNLSNENEKKVVDVVKLSLERATYVFSPTIEKALSKHNDSLHSKGDELLHHSDGGKSILYNWANGHALGRLSRPIFGGIQSNTQFFLDPGIGYMHLYIALEEALQLIGYQGSRIISTPMGSCFPGLSGKLQFDDSGKYVGKLPRKEFVMFRNHEQMLEDIGKRIVSLESELHELDNVPTLEIPKYNLPGQEN